MLGQDVFPTFNSYASAAWMVNWGALGMVSLGERSWQARWMEGNDINLGLQIHETERTSIVSYTVQGGVLKGFGAMWMNIGVNARDSSAYEENRMILTYTLKIW